MSTNPASHDPAAWRDRYGPRALILGGSEGIGASFAEQLAAQGFDLTLAARRAGPLEETAARLRAAYGIDVATQVLDLTAPDLPVRASEIVSGGDFGLVVYNAGATHGAGLFLDQPLDKALGLVALNCAGPVAFAHHALAPMRRRGKGGLILLSSMSGMAGCGYVATYAATKSFEMILAEGLHWEMQRDGVDVLCAVATLTDTPAMARSGLIIDADPDFVAMDPAVVAAGALANLGQRAVWFAAGEEAERGLRSAPREALTDQMSRVSARMYGITP